MSAALAGDPALIGEWQGTTTWPAVAVHAMMMQTGKVLFFRGDGTTPESWTWDPGTGAFSSQQPGVIIFCAGHSQLPDGRILVTGGALPGSGGGVTSTGPKWVRIFDPITETWSAAPDMAYGRYYPTNVLLPDGRTFAIAGDDENGDHTRQVEAFLPGSIFGGSDRWEYIPNADRSMSYYPRIFLIPSGKILRVGYEAETYTLDPATGFWQFLAENNYGKRTHGTAVMLPPGFSRILILGGRNRSGSDPFATATAEILDLSAPTPAWRLISPMTYRRIHPNTVILPDGKVLVAGGSADDDETLPAFVSELFDPVTETWTEMAPMHTFRNYHSSALLLPDGTVLWAGSNSNPTAEIYRPYYLFRGARPTITSARGSVVYGEHFTVTTPESDDISSVVLMRLGQSTHSFNNEQRYVPLSFTTAGSGALDVTAPASPVTAPQGYYMLFILNGAGVPSRATFVLLGDTPPGNSVPVVSAGPDRSVHRPAPPFIVTLQGSVNDDGLPDPPGMTEVAWDQIDGPGTVTFDDETLPAATATFPAPGTYRLRLTAWDGEYAAEDTVRYDIIEGSTPITTSHRVAAGSDDAEEKSSGSMYLTSSDLEMTFDSSQQVIGIRFTGVAIPQGAPILDARIQFQVDETGSEATALQIQTEAIGSAATFTTASRNVSSRARSVLAVPWNPPSWSTTGASGSDQTTPNLAPIVQEVVSRSDWAGGNALAFIITGTGKRVAESFDGAPAAAPLLIVTYSPGATNLPPQSTIVQPLADTTITQGAGVLFMGTGADPDGNEPLTYRWDFEGGAPPLSSANPGVVVFSAAGTWTASFTATDSLGLADPTPDTRIISVVANQPPESFIDEPAGDVTIQPGGTVRFEGHATDPDMNLPIEASWNFGGGVPPENWQDDPMQPGEVRFDQPGSHLVTFTAEDALGMRDPTPATRMVTVLESDGVSVDQIHWTIMGQRSVAFNWRASSLDDPARTIEWSELSRYDAWKDATIHETTDGSIANGSGDYLHVGNNGTGDARRSLIAFDIAGSVPAGSTINGATLNLNLSRTRVGPVAVTVHRVLSAWSEGPSNAGANEGGGDFATTGDVTWLHTNYPTGTWNSAGGDYAAIPSAGTLVDQVGRHEWSSGGLAADVQGWLDSPADNHGWILIGDESVFPTSKRFDSRSHPDPAVRPTLTLDVTDPNGRVWIHSMPAGEASPAPSSSAQHFLEAVLTGLEEDTTYRYRVASGPAHTFRTPPPRGGTNFWIAVTGDMGSRLDHPESIQVQQMLALDNGDYPGIEGSEPMRFVIVNGGLTYGADYGHASVDAHFNDVMTWSRDVAYMPAWGDHEHGPDPICAPGQLTPAGCVPGNMNDYSGRFALPGARGAAGAPAAGDAEDWYWFDYGNVRFIAVPEPYPGAIAAWEVDVDPIMAAAQLDQDITFIVTFGHRNTWSSALDQPDGSAGPLATAIAGLHARYNKLVLHLSAHARSTEVTDPSQTGGVVHLRQPGGGAPLGGLAPAQPPWSAFRINHLTHTRLRFSRSAITGYIVCGPSGAGSTEACGSPEPLAGTAAFGASAETTDRLGGAPGDDPGDDHGPGGGPSGEISHVFSINDPNLTGPPANQPPNGQIHEPEGDLTITAGAIVSFHGAGLDPDGNLPLSWEWDFGGGAPDSSQQTPGAVLFATPGAFEVRLTVRDSLGLADPTPDTRIVIVESAAVIETLEVRVSTGADDVEETSTGTPKAGSSDMELVTDGTKVQTVGLRFGEIDIPAGAIIHAAHVRFTVDEPDTADTMLSIRAHAADDAPPFTSAKFDVSSRPRTLAAVAWSPAGWAGAGTSGPAQITPDLAALIQEIVNRPGWAPGGAVALIITGTGTRTAEAYDGSPGEAPLLHIEYSRGGPPVNRPPDVDAGADQAIDFGASTLLDGTITDDGLMQPIVVTWSHVSGPAVIGFASPGTADTLATFGPGGEYVARLSAFDGQYTVEDDVRITVREPGAAPVVIDVRVATSLDDAEERTGGSMSLTSSDLEMVMDGTKVQTVGIRFQGVAIPRGASIRGAWVQFQADETGTDGTQLTIRAQAADNAGALASTSSDISTRAMTSAVISWNPPAWTSAGAAGDAQRTPDLAPLIQEVVNRPGWSSGNAILIIVTGSGKRVAEAYDGVPSGAPLLHVEFE